MSVKGKITINHNEIKNWVESRGGRPARVKGVEKKDDPDLLRINYPDYSGGETLEEISWNEFFDSFEKNRLAFLYQEGTGSGEESRFSKLISRDERSSNW